MEPRLYSHPNGKKKKDQKGDSSGDAKFNTRDLTPVGQRPPSARNAVVPEDPEATASRARNQHRRIKYQQTDSD